MFRYSRCIVWLLLCVMMAGCSKEMSYEPTTEPVTGSPDPTGALAEFTFVPTSNHCSDATVSGVFEAGKAVPAGALIKVTVNVAKKGNWGILTNVVNGMLFTGTGVFTATGVQSVVLQASGLPTRGGTHAYLLKAGSTSCSVLVNVTNGEEEVLSDCYYKIVIDGKTYQQDVTEDNNYEAGSGLGGVDDVTISAGINYNTSGGEAAPKGTTGFGVTKGIMHRYVYATNAEFRAFFAPGTYTIRKDFRDGDGVSMGWLDAEGEEWDTESGSGDQTGSTFRIVSVTDMPNFVGTYYIKVKMTFTCKLYNRNTGAVKQVSNGEMIGIFGKI
ncbi:hypothetical protein [Chitinophaga nivalis]|uniref:DUF5689 domain-containing protein n=1 Tax=Chitinophaga nivalis TaxID=2991709 RepID=A0ABT3IJE7_9BACT|nr:hypothetical protein [Chitinophaga nivalis]MCW3466232.1 hypothetical protein [Chitinophaga nivalis]MCW3484077.1 hypothetical protein [Chitinophaga nivalis]